MEAAGATMKKILDDAKPEAAYFTETGRPPHRHYCRRHAKPIGYSEICRAVVSIFNAEVRFRIAMTPEDLGQCRPGGTRQEVGLSWREKLL